MNVQLDSRFCVEAGYAADDAHDFGMHHIWDDDLRRYDALRPGEQLFVCFEGLCMGWSWSLYLCQKLFENLVSILLVLPEC